MPAIDRPVNVPPTSRPMPRSAPSSTSTPRRKRARRAAVDLWRQVGDRLKEGENLAELAWPLVRSGRNAAADETNRRAIEVLESLPPSRQLANAYRVQAHLRLLDCDKALAVRLGKKAIELARRFDDVATIAATENVIGSALLAGRRSTRGSAHLQRSIAPGRASRASTPCRHRATPIIASSYAEQYRFGEAEHHLDEGIAYTAERDLDYANHYMHAWLALTRLYQGRWTEAADIASWVIARPKTSAISRIMALVALGRVRVRRGEPGADQVLDEALDLAAQTQSLQRLAPVRGARAEAAWLAGDDARAVGEATAACELALAHRHRWFVGELLLLASPWRRRGRGAYLVCPAISISDRRKLATGRSGMATARLSL